MDRELLDALNNLSLSLDEISKALKKKSESSVSNSLMEVDFSKSLESIGREIVQISKDTSEIRKDQSKIISNQNTIIKMISDLKSERSDDVKKKVSSPTTIREVGDSRSRSEEDKIGSFFDGLSKNTSKIKDGLSTIVLIASGILAIGMAFKVIGKVDIPSVLALSLALPIIALSFQKISEIGLKSSDVVNISLLIVGMITSITISSMILSTIQPIDPIQAASAILISGVFVGLSYGMSKIIQSIKGVNIITAIGSSFLLPVLMVAMSAAIAGSSVFLGMVKPIGLFQGISAILISGVFVGISHSIGGIVSSLKGISPSTAAIVSLISPLILVAMSAAIAGSSVFLGMVKPIGLFQGISAILISGVFVGISFGLSKIIGSMKGISPGSILASSIGLPIILIAISYAISKSSEYLSEVKPIGLFQALTSVLISGIFAILGFGIGKMIQGFRGVSPATAAIASATMPLVFIALTYAIKVGSEFLSEVKPIGLFQFLTALGISVVFVALSYSVKPLMRGVQGIGVADVGKGVLVILALTTAVVAASYLITEIKPISISQGLTFIGTAIAVGSGSLIMGLALKGLSKIGTLKEFERGSLSLILVATTVVAVSHIISMGDYSTYPPISWTVGVAASMIPFGLGMVLIGEIASSGIGALSLLAGGLAMVGIALTIVGVSHILKMGDYSTYPPISWTVGVAASMIPFGLGMVALGPLLPLVTLGVGSMILVAKTIKWTSEILRDGDYSTYPPISWTVGVAASMIPFGLGMVVLGPLLPLVTLGVGSTLLVAKTIKWTSEILRDGDYSKYPDLGWSKGTSLTLGSFALGMSMLGGVIFATFGLGRQMLEAGSNAVLSVAKTIVSSSDILANGYQDDNGNKFRPNYSGGPTKSWAEGIAISLGAFSPIYSMLMRNSVLSLFGIGGIGPDDFTNAIKTVSEGIVSAASFFASPNNPGVWSGYPTKDWAEGVGIAIGAFSPVYDILLRNTGIFKSGISIDQFVSAIDVISRGLVSAANFFSKNKSPFSEGNYPSKEWGEGVGSALGAFAPVFEILSGSNNMWVSRKSISSLDLSNAILLISSSIVEVSKKFKGGIFRKEDSPSEEWSEGVKRSIEAFGSIFGFITDNSGWFGSDIGEVSNAIIQIGTDIAKVSRVISLGVFDTKIDPKWISSIKSITDGYISIVNKVGNFEIDDISDSKKVIDLIISSVSSISSKLGLIKFTEISAKSWVDQMKSTLHTFSNFISGIPKTVSKDLISSGTSTSLLLLSSISKISNILGSISYGSKIPPDEWSVSINAFMTRFISIFTKFSKYSKDTIISGFSNVLMIFKSISLISDVKIVYPTVPGVDWINAFEAFVSNFGRVILSSGKNFNEDLITDGKNSISQILKIVGIISNGFQGISYLNTPPENWISSVDHLVRRFGHLSNYLESEVSSIGLIGSRLKIGQVISSISDIANQFSSLSFVKFPDTSWLGGIVKSVISVSILMKDIDNRLSIFDISGSREKILEVSKTISIMGRSFSNLEFKKIDTNWISSVSTLISNFTSSISGVSKLTKSEFGSSRDHLLSMVDIVMDLTTRLGKLNVPSEIFGKITNLSDLFKSVDGLIRMNPIGLSEIDKSSTSFDRLSKSIDGLGNSLSNIDSSKLSQISSITNLSDLFKSVDGLIRMNPIGLSEIDKASTSFDRLSKSIDGLGNSLSNIDSSKLSQISSIKSGSILINLVADDQFNQLIQSIEKSSGIFVEALNNMKKESPNVKVSGESVSDVKIDSQEDTQSLEIQFQILNALKDIQEVIGRGKTVDNYLKEKTNIGSLLRK